LVTLGIVSAGSVGAIVGGVEPAASETWSPAGIIIVGGAENKIKNKLFKTGAGLVILFGSKFAHSF